MKVLIVPDKFKGTLSASDAARAIRRGWENIRPTHSITTVPMSDGGDGFGEIISNLIGAKPQRINTVNAAHQPVVAKWWWEPTRKIAVIESAKVIGLAMLPPQQFHPFSLDTFGLGKVLQAASDKGAQTCIIGIGGSATNDAGFGLAQALGWEFFDQEGTEIHSWTKLSTLSRIERPKRNIFFKNLIIAVDVGNTLLGAQGCSRIYGPQKGLRSKDIKPAENNLRRLAQVSARLLETDLSKIPGSGAAGGLGFGLMAFAGGKQNSGFEIFAEHSRLHEQIKNADVVITGEGAIDKQTLMGKGVGQVALLCRKLKKPCIGLAGVVADPKKAERLFNWAGSLTDITNLAAAKANPTKYLIKLAEAAALKWDRAESKACERAPSR